MSESKAEYSTSVFDEAVESVQRRGFWDDEARQPLSANRLLAVWVTYWRR